jgi:hypothetical protein
MKDDTLPFWCINAGRRIGCCLLYRDRRRNVLKMLDLLCEDPVGGTARCIAAVRTYAVMNRFDAITTNVAGGLHRAAFLRSGFWPVRRIPSYVIPTDRETMSRPAYDDRFWFQMPIDRDNSDY